MPIVFIVLLGICAVCLLVFAVTWVLLCLNMRPGGPPELSRPENADNTRWAPYARELAEGIARIRAMPWESVQITAYDGLRLHGRLLRAGAGRTVLLVHGYRSCGENDFAGIVDYYVNAGFSILMIDQRAHGESEGRRIYFGVRERYDVQRWAEFAQKECPGPLWLHGISMGAASCLMAAGLGLPEGVRGVIADSSFTSPRDTLAYQMKRQYHLPYFPFVPIGTLAGMCISGRDFACGSVENAAARSKLPMLFISGGKDHAVPPDSTLRLHAARGGGDALLIVPEARHAVCWLEDAAAYADALDRFIKG